MDATRATFALAGTRFARFRWVDETGSTNADLLAAARAGESEQVLGAEHQTAGRGRLGRTWESDAGESVLCSVLVRPSDAAGAVADAHLVTTALGLAAAEAIDDVCGVRVGIKWPNDLVAGTADAPDDRKVAGVLAESVVSARRVAAVVAGIGVNVARAPIDGAVSVRELAGIDVDRTDLVVAMLLRLESHLASPDAVRDAVAARSATIGRTVRVERSGGELVGLATGLTSGGHLLVDAEGVTHEITVGDVIHLRPTD